VKAEVAKKITEGATGARAAVVVVRAVKARARVVESRCGINWFS
jgi:hypothetical protein